MNVPFGAAQKGRKGRRGIVDIVLAIALTLFHALEHLKASSSPFPRLPGPQLVPLFPSLQIYPEESLSYNSFIAVDEKPEEFLFEPDLATHKYNAFSEVKSGELNSS